MAQLWGGRFTKETDQLVYNFNASISFDKKFYRQDMEGSIAHVKMLGKQGILTEQEMEDLVAAVKQILHEVEQGELEISHEYEDIHSFVEATLIDRLGDTGKKLHTGRSRNDQVALDMRLYTRNEVLATDELLEELLHTILAIMEEHTDTFMPGFTHLQKAQPVTLAHHLGAYFEMFKRDRQRMQDIYRRMNYCPLGSGALAGTTYDLDRHYTAELLGFEGPTLNSMDGVSDRDYLIEYLSALSTVMMHLSRFSEEVIIWNSNEYQFVEIDDAYSTGSSIMPQKKNPDMAELLRGKVGRVYGDLMQLLTVMKGTALAYNKDFQEDKESLFDAIDTWKASITIFAKMLENTEFRMDQIQKQLGKGFLNATDIAEHFAKQGIPFREAHSIVGRMVKACENNNCDFEDLTDAQLQEIDSRVTKETLGDISIPACVEARVSYGGTAPSEVRRQIAKEKEWLDSF